MAFDMEEYAQQACDLYESVEGAKPLKTAPRPFLPDGSLVEADSDTGELAAKACSVLTDEMPLARSPGATRHHQGNWSVGDKGTTVVRK